MVRKLEKGENEGQLRRAARSGDKAAYERLKEAGRTNGSDKRAYKQAQNASASTGSGKGRKQAGSSPATPGLSKNERVLRRQARQGNTEAFEELRKAGRTNGSDKRAYEKARAAMAPEGNDASSSGMGGNQPARAPAPKPPSWVERIMKASPSRIPAARQEKFVAQVVDTVEDLKRRGYDEGVAQQVAESYANEWGMKNLPAAERKWIEKHEGRGGR